MFTRSTIALFIAVMLAFSPGKTAAANSKDVARAKDVSRLGECSRCDLSNANFENGFFQLAILNEVNFSGSKLDGANFAGAQLNNADLRNTTLRYANMSGARLEGADLRGADLSNAWLNWAWLIGAKLDGANFTNTVFIGVQMQATDFSKVKGLTQEQVSRACASPQTKLPPGMRISYCQF